MQCDHARMERPPFDPHSPGAKLLAQTARHMRDWQRTAAVTFHAPITGRFEPDEPRSFKPGDHAEIPIAWARSLVERGIASYQH
jgi:hypothetical protein